MTLEDDPIRFREHLSDHADSNATLGDPMSLDLDEEYLTRFDAMELLGVKKTAFGRLIRDHNIPSCKLTRHPLYRKSDLVRLIERHMTYGSLISGTKFDEYP